MSHLDPILLGDIGGTNARFAVLSRGTIGPVERIKVAECSGAIAAIESFLGRREGRPPVKSAVLGLAGAVESNRCEIFNSGWTVDARVLEETFDLQEVQLLNDFEVLAWSLPHLKGKDLFSLGEGAAVARAPILLIGPGTGFGASCLLPRDGSPIVVASEAGHSTLSGTSVREDGIIDQLRRRFGHVSVERAVSGPGLVNLYEALATIDGKRIPKRDAALVTQAALDGNCPFSGAAFDMFCGMLGTVAANLALTFCARGGVYIAGGIVPRFPKYLARSKFRSRFEAAGRYHAYLHEIPVNIILRPDIAFLGLKALVENRDGGSTPTSLRSPAHDAERN